MTFPLVSILVPVYGVEQYIERCARSIFEQTYHNLEIIFVDDCTPDKSIEIVKKVLEEYPERKEQVRIIRHEKNRGLSAARNTATEASTGDFIYYLDSDDAITPDCIELLEKPMEEGDWDVVTADYDEVDMDSGKVAISDRELTGTDIADQYCHAWFRNAWNKLCRRSFLIKNNLQFIPGIYYEDVPWTFKIACTAKRLKVVGKITYHYYYRQSSIMNNGKTRKSFDSYCMVLSDIRRTQRDYRNLNSNLEYEVLYIQQNLSKAAKLCNITDKVVYSIFRQRDSRPWFWRLRYYLHRPRLLPFNFHWLLPPPCWLSVA